MEIYRKFVKKNIGLEPFGIYPWGEDDLFYDSTPTGARAIGRTGVDGVHYCFVRGYGETVFAVSPMNEPGECVHPVARSFEEFLGLLIACRGEAALEQSWMWDRQTFETFVAGEEHTPEQAAAAARLEEELAILPETDPFACLQEIREEVDCSRLKFSREYMELTAEDEPEEEPWLVRLGDRGRPGRECRMNTRFRWAGRDFLIPSVYLCGKGLVMDFCISVPADREQAFLDRWSGKAEEELTAAEREQITAENPLYLEYEPTAAVNGRDLPWKDGQGGSWCGCLAGYDGTERNGQAWMEHYGLDRSCCWSFMRYSFPWVTSRRPEIRSLSVKLEAVPQDATGPAFTVEAGDRVELVHPATGEVHTLEVLDYKEERLEGETVYGNYRYPDRLWSLEYVLTPDLPQEEFQLRDSGGDRPRPLVREEREPAPKEQEHEKFCYVPEAQNDAAILGIIGGEDGPTAICCMSCDQPETGHAALSGLYFDLPEQVRWSPVFRIRPAENIEIYIV